LKFFCVDNFNNPDIFRDTMYPKAVYLLLVLGVGIVLMQGIVIAEKTVATSVIKPKISAQSPLSGPQNVSMVPEMKILTKMDATQAPGGVTLENPVAAQSLVDVAVLTEDELEDSPYQNSEWVVTGASGITGGQFYFDALHVAAYPSGDGFMVCEIPPDDVCIPLYLPLAVKADGYIRYLKFITEDQSYRNKGEIDSVSVFNGPYSIGYYDTTLWSFHSDPDNLSPETHYLDLGDYYQFDKGLQIGLCIKNHASGIAGFILNGYGARVEW
jgi:hypothetical protein